MAESVISQIEATTKAGTQPTMQDVNMMADYQKKLYEKLAGDRVEIDLKAFKIIQNKEYKELLDFEKKKSQLRKEAQEQALEDLRAQYLFAESQEEKAAIEKRIRNKKIADEFKNSILESLKSVGKAVTKTLSNTLNASTSGINAYLGSYSQYMSGIEARIQGSGKTFKGLTGSISRNLAGSQYVSQTKMLENLNNLIAQGIVYNVEQRAFLQTVSDKMVTTFNALDDNLREIIKIQQADSTAARLGLEAELTQFLNANFGDTSYLNSLFDSIAGALIGTSSQLGRDRSVAFEYNIQKWLGSLSSVGVSGSTIQSLAKGINYLGTSDISALTGDEQLLRLFSIGAQQAGLDIGSIMTNGLTPDDANKLMRGVVELGQQIASNSNQVIKSQLGQLFGFTMSDLTAILNLKDDLNTLTKSVIDYTSAVQETKNQLQAIPGRVTLKDKIDTLFNNVMAGLGESIANNAATYTTWVVNELIKGATGGGVEVNIPFLGAVNLNNAVSAGIAGMGLISQVGNIIGGLQRGSGLDLDT